MDACVLPCPQLKQSRRQVAELLRGGKSENARIRVESVMREEQMLQAYEGALLNDARRLCEANLCFLPSPGKPMHGAGQALKGLPGRHAD